MGTTVDRRVVSMEIENKAFQKGVDESIQSLDALKKSLDLDGASRGLVVLGEAAEKIGVKFDALQVIATRTLTKITDAVEGTASKMFKALTTDNISAGFTKYEQKIGAVQTIMAATGKSIDVVNDQLDKLNWYTDETSYNFTDMVTSIGKFTSAGVGLEDSVTAMMGIANWAAKSGANSQAASRAMYNLSQAMGVGALKLQDWKSIEGVNMATVEFKNQCLEAAVAIGTLRKEGDRYFTNTGKKLEVTNASLSETLSEGWLNTQVMMEVFTKYGAYSEELYKIVSDETNAINTCSEAMEYLSTEGYELSASAHRAAQEAKTFTDVIESVKEAVASGWSKTFELLFGNYEEAVKLWTITANGLYEVFAEGGNRRNEMMEAWKGLGGRNDVLNILANLIDALASVIKPFEQAFHELFPPMTAERLKEITGNLVEFTSKLQLSESASKRLKDTFKGGFAIIKMGIRLLKGLWDVTAPLRSLIGYLADKLLSATAASGRFFSNLEKGVVTTEGISGVVKFFLGNIEAAKNALLDFLGTTDPLGSLGEKIGPGINWLITKFFEIVEAAKGGMSGIKEFLKANIDFGVIGTTASNAFEGAKSAVDSLVEAVGNAKTSIATGADSIGAVFVNVATAIKDTLLELKSWIQLLFKDADLRDLVDVGYLATFVYIQKQLGQLLKTFKSTVASWKSPASALNETLGGINKTLKAYQKDIKYRTLKGIALAIVAMAGAVLLLASIPKEKMIQGVEGLSVLLAELTAMMIAFDKLIGKDFSTKFAAGAAAILAIGGSILLLASSVKILADIFNQEGGQGSLVAGVLATTVLLVALVGMMNKLEASGLNVKGAIKLIGIAAAVNVLAKAVATLGDLDWKTTLVGTGEIVALLIGLGAFAESLGKNGGGQLILAAAGIALLSFALKAFKGTLEEFATLWDTTNPDKVKQTATGLVTIAGILAGLVGLLAFSSSFGSLGAAASMVVLVGAIGLLVSVCKNVNDIDEKKLSDVMTTLILALGGLTVIGALAQTIAPAMALIVASLMGFVSIIAIFGLGLQAVAVGFDKFIVAFDNFFEYLQKLGAKSDSEFNLMAVGLQRFADMMVMILEASLRAASKVILTIIEESLRGFLVVIEGVLNALDEKIGPIADKLLSVLTQIFRAIGDHGQELGYEFSRALIEVMVGVTMYLLDVVAEFMNGVWKALSDYFIQYKSTINNQMEHYAYEMADPFTQFLYKALMALLGPFGPKVWEAITGGSKGDKMGREAGGKSAENYTTGFTKSMKENEDEVYAAGHDVGDTALNALHDSLDEHSPSWMTWLSGKNVDVGFGDGIIDNLSYVSDALAKLSDLFRKETGENLGFEGPLDEDGNQENPLMETAGENIATNLTNGISTGLSKSKTAEEAAKEKAQSIIDAFSKALDAAALNITTTDLEQKLWEAMNYNLEDKNYEYQAQIQTFEKKLVFQQDRVNQARQEYEKTLAEFGESNKYTQESYNRYLQEQTEYFSMLNSITDLQKEQIEYNKEVKDKATEQWAKDVEALEAQRVNMQAYVKYISENQEALANLGLSEEDIRYAARRQTGYDPEELKRLQDAVSKKTTEAAEVSVATVTSAYTAAAEGAVESVAPTFTNVGVSYVSAVGDGIQNGSENVKTKTVEMVYACTNVLEEHRRDWYNAGENCIQGFIDGVSANIDLAAKIVASMAENALEAAREALQIASPSKATYEFGRYFDYGFANGVRDYATVSENSVSDLAEGSMETFRTVLSTLQNAVADEMDLQPTITPVLDLSDVKTSAKKLNGMIPGSANLNLSTTAYKAQSAAPVTQQNQLQPQTQAAGTTVNNFTQNNYSPKALSRLELYRQTKSLFTSLKGR